MIAEGSAFKNGRFELLHTFGRSHSADGFKRHVRICQQAQNELRNEEHKGLSTLEFSATARNSKNSLANRLKWF
jgi:hypothetical protein